MIVDLAVSAGVALIAGTFAVALRRRRFDTIDTVWGLGFAAIAVVTCALATGDLVPRILSTLFTVGWGVRLSVHIHLRNRGGGEDKRYAQMQQRPGRMFVRVYLTQAALIWLVSLPVQVAQYGRGAPVFLYCVAVMVWAVGFAFETIGDYQLQRFRADPANRGKALGTGLWGYTRHPNYFGDACVWWGLYLLACQSWLGAATIVSPIVMTALLAKGTGKPRLERQLIADRPDYAAYLNHTSSFFPLPPRRSASEAGGEGLRLRPPAPRDQRDDHAEQHRRERVDGVVEHEQLRVGRADHQADQAERGHPRERGDHQADRAGELQ
jgi:steroid 5-alpha reductase family enzyme